MGEQSKPLLVEYGEPLDGLRVARQAPPPAAASFSATYLAPAGHAFDPEGREGLALLTSELLTSGAGRLGRIPFARELDRLGGTIQARCSPETTELTVWGPESAREKLLDLWALAGLSPRFDAEDIDRVRLQLFERQLREMTQPASRAERELFRAVFPKGHPYRETGLGSRQSIQRLRARDFARFHAQHFTREGSLVVVTTRQSTSAVQRAVAHRLHSFSRSQAPLPPSTPFMHRRGTKIRRVVMKDRPQLEIRIGGPSIRRASPEYPAAFLANEVLGGRPLLSRLFQNVRERHGLAYNAGSELDPMRWGGVWQVHAGTGPERAERVLELVESEIERVRSEPVRRAELDQIRESAIGEITVQLETTAGAHECAVDIAYHELPGDFFARWPATLRRLTAAEVRSGAEAAFDRANMATVLAGPLEGSIA